MHKHNNQGLLQYLEVHFGVFEVARKAMLREPLLNAFEGGCDDHGLEALVLCQPEGGGVEHGIIHNAFCSIYK